VKRAELLRRNTAVPNYFASPEVADRYRRTRPFFHRKLAEEINAFSGLFRFSRALDVGCGTGQSTIALAEIADSVIAIDASEEMLRHAPPRPNVRYQLGMAEQLDFGTGEFDLVSVGSALHWFDQTRFFAQCQAVLSKTGVLAVYNDHFTTHMEGAAAFNRWMRTRLANRYPTPLRGMKDMDERKAIEAGFLIAHRSSFNHLVPFSRDGLIAYLLTRSNTLACIHAGKEAAAAISDWLSEELAPFLPNGVTGSFIFKCNFWLMRKAPGVTRPITCGLPSGT
jgi:ubiquinone/menaquinone biosynthesis C-methylase UbiE